MTRNALYLLIVAMGTVLAVLAYLYYDETRSRGGIAIQVDENGLTLEQK